MSYAIPHILAENNNLKVFFTDVHANHFLFQFIEFIIPNRFLPKKLKNLFARKLPSKLLKKFIIDCPFSSMILHSNNEKLSEFLLNRALKKEFFGANSIYTNFINNDLEYIKRAKDKGMFIVHEMSIAPDSGLIMYEENQRFPELNSNNLIWEDVEKGILLDKEKWELCDQILVPSKYCLKSALNMGADSKKISLVPYGIREELFNFKPKVQKGRILLVGEIGLRKGAHYFAEACRILFAKGKKYHFVAAVYQ